MSDSSIEIPVIPPGRLSAPIEYTHNILFSQDDHSCPEVPFVLAAELWPLNSQANGQRNHKLIALLQKFNAPVFGVGSDETWFWNPRSAGALGRVMPVTGLQQLDGILYSRLKTHPDDESSRVPKREDLWTVYLPAAPVNRPPQMIVDFILWLRNQPPDVCIAYSCQRIATDSTLVSFKGGVPSIHPTEDKTLSELSDFACAYRQTVGYTLMENPIATNIANAAFWVHPKPTAPAE